MIKEGAQPAINHFQKEEHKTIVISKLYIEKQEKKSLH